MDIDTTKNYTYANLLQQKYIVADVANEYFMDNLSYLEASYPTLDSFVEGWNATEELVEESIRRGVEAGVEPVEGSMEDSRTLLGHYIKCTIATNLWGMEGYMKVANTHFEEGFTEAVNVLLNPARYGEILCLPQKK